jgi:hypothetical protein
MISFCERFPEVKDIKETEMNKGKRRHHSAEFKVQVVLEAAPGVFDQSRSAAKQELGKEQKSWRVGEAKPINSSRLSVAQLFWFSVNWKKQVEALRSGRVGFGV